MKLGTIQAGSQVSLRWEDDRIAVITLCDVANKNALSPELVAALLSCLQETHKNAECSVVLLKAEGEYFCSGANQALLEGLKEGTVVPTELGLTPIMLEHSSVIISVAEGHAIGGGMALLLASDFAFIATQSRYALNFMVHGITPGMGVTALAEDSLGKRLAHRMLYTGDLVKGEQFTQTQFDLGEKETLYENALNLAYGIAEKPPENVKMLKKSLNDKRLAALQEALKKEQAMHKKSIKHLSATFWEQS